MQDHDPHGPEETDSVELTGLQQRGTGHLGNARYHGLPAYGDDGEGDEERFLRWGRPLPDTAARSSDCQPSRVGMCVAGGLLLIALGFLAGAFQSELSTFPLVAGGRAALRPGSGCGFPPSYLPTLLQLEQDLALHYIDHDPGCERLLVHGYSRASSGFGSQVNLMLFNFAVSLWENRTLLLLPDWLLHYRCAPSGPSYATCFKPLMLGPPGCDPTLVDRYAHVNYTAIRQWDNLNRSVESVAVLRSGTFDQLYWYMGSLMHDRRMPGELGRVGRHAYTHFDLKAYALRRLWVLQDNIKAEVDRRVSTLDLSPPLCGFHVRRGDKVVEAPPQPLERYLEIAQRSWLRCRTCFFASDDLNGTLAEARAELGRYLPGCKVVSMAGVQPPVDPNGFNISEFQGGDASRHAQSTLELLSEMEVLTRADLFVGSYSSNVGTLVTLLRASRGMHPASSFSVDKLWHPFRRRR